MSNGRRAQLHGRRSPQGNVKCRNSVKDDSETMYNLTVLRRGAPRPIGACRCSHGRSPSSFLTASLTGSSTLRGPPEPPCCPKIASIIDENFHRRCVLRYDDCRSRSQSLDSRRSIVQVESRWSNALDMCSRLRPPLSVRGDHGGGSLSTHRLGVCSRGNDRRRSAQ